MHLLYTEGTVNPWGIKKNEIMKLKEFQAYIADCLIKIEKKKAGRPATNEEVKPNPPKRTRIEPPKEVRFDGVDHRLTFMTCGKCAQCKTGKCETACKKCNLRLCTKKNKNCFDDYHYVKK